MAKRSDDVASLLLGWVAICSPVFTQNRTASRPRELSIAGTDGQPSGLVAVRAEMDGVAEAGMPLLRDAAEATEEELAAVHEQFVTHFMIAGLDFDGHPDLAGIRDSGAKWARYCVWLYDQKQHWYGKDFLAEQMESLRNPQPFEAGQISSSHMGRANSWIAV